ATPADDPVHHYAYVAEARDESAAGTLLSQGVAQAPLTSADVAAALREAVARHEADERAAAYTGRTKERTAGRHIFISYSRADRAYVSRLAAHLATVGIPVWYDFEVETGERFSQEIQQAIDECAAFVVVLTPASVASEWVRREISRAVRKDKRILPLLLSPCDTPIELERMQQEDVTDGQMPAPRCIAYLRGLVSPPAPTTRDADVPAPDTDPARDNEFTARYLDYLAQTLDRFEFWAVDQRGIVRTHSFRSGYVPLTLGPRGPSEQWVTAGVRADQALANCARALVWGVAGAGKSTLLRWLAVCAAQERSGPDTADRAVATGRIPFLIELGRFPDGQLPKLDSLVPEHLREQMPHGWAPRIFAEGRAMVLIDGLDEVGPLSQEGIEGYVHGFSVWYPDVRFITTTRPAAVTEQWWVDHGFERFDLLSLSRHSIQAFVHGWHEVAKHDYEDDPEQQRWIDESEYDLLNTLSNRPALRTMAGNPLLCGLLCALHLWRGRTLPEGRNQVLDDAIDLLLVRWPQRRRFGLGGSASRTAATDIRLGK